MCVTYHYRRLSSVALPQHPRTICEYWPLTHQRTGSGLACTSTKNTTQDLVQDFWAVNNLRFATVKHLANLTQDLASAAMFTRTCLAINVLPVPGGP